MSSSPQSGIPTSIGTAPQWDQPMRKDKVGHMDWERGAGEPFPTPRKMWCISPSSQVSHLPAGWKPTGKHHSLQSSFAPQEAFVKGLAVLQEIPHPHLKLWLREGAICTLEVNFRKQLSCFCLTRSRGNSSRGQAAVSRSALPCFLPPLQRRKTCPGFSQTSQPLDNNASVSRTASHISEEVIRRLPPHSSSGDNASPRMGSAPAPPLAAPARMQAERDTLPWRGQCSPKG